ncbi:MAG: DNA methyltransferase [Bacteroidetes bacterium SW_9_63_38]|nr:MAG: DNA methyltransferase [Bacteroidetes bacterium SW_9_63_38]
MNGHHPTPPALATRTARRLFAANPPSEGDRILYPGCGAEAPFAKAVETICQEGGTPVPSGLAVEKDPGLAEQAEGLRVNHIRVRNADFLGSEMAEEGPFDYVLGNPPYVPIEGLSEDEKTRYRSHFRVARGRFDLYLLFFERALSLLAPEGRLVFVTPEKWEYVETAGPLRTMVTGGGRGNASYHVEEINHIDEDAFPQLTAYPSVTTVRKSEEGSAPAGSDTRIQTRDGTTHQVELPSGGKSWAAAVRGKDLSGVDTGLTLGDVTVRVSPGMATGADAVFVFENDEVPEGLAPTWTRPTVSGKELTHGGASNPESVFACPYRSDGTLPKERELGAFGEWARQHRERLENRSCVQKAGKPWYAWHETPPMQDLLRPKIVFKDIAKEPTFWAERTGEIIPRHTVYYLVPEEGISFDRLLDYLNGSVATEWMEAHCQRAANGFLRLQSRVLRKLPVPTEVARERQGALAFN